MAKCFGREREPNNGGNMQLGDNSGGRSARGYSRKLDLLFLDVGMPAGIHP